MLYLSYTRRITSPYSIFRTAGLFLTAIFFIAAGANHLIHPDFYRRIMPPMLPFPDALVLISGLAEIAGGAGLLTPVLRKPAGWGLILLLIAIFPANLYMAFADTDPSGHDFPKWSLYLRLPFQFVFIAWVWWIAIHRTSRRRSGRMTAYER